MESRTVHKGGSAEIVEKKSRFIGEVFPVEHEEEAMQLLEQVKKKYWDARHHCWAYVISGDRVQERLSDDGEPSGTAGKPILEVIHGAAGRQSARCCYPIFRRNASRNRRSCSCVYRSGKTGAGRKCDHNADHRVQAQDRNGLYRIGENPISARTAENSDRTVGIYGSGDIVSLGIGRSGKRDRAGDHRSDKRSGRYQKGICVQLCRCEWRDAGISG